jgi:D-sedoheptulose 7-phosphate isomerase
MITLMLKHFYKMNVNKVLIDNLTASINAKNLFIEDKLQGQVFEDATNEVIKRYKLGGRIYIAGNGGSAADAQHIAAEFVSKLAKDRNPLPAEALTVDSSILTAIGNDYGFEKIFSRQIIGKVTSKDIFLAITTSGMSQNILEALKVCKEMGIPSILFTGKDGGLAKALATYTIIAPGNSTAIIQEIHILMAHTLCQCVEMELFIYH